MLPAVTTPAARSLFLALVGTAQLTGLVLLGACGPKGGEPVRSVAAPVQSAPAAVAQAPEPVAAGAWHELRSAWPGPLLVREPAIAWQARLSGPVVHPLRSDDALLYASSAGTLVALRADGSSAWTARIQASGAAGLAGEGVVVGTEDGPVALYDRERGALVRQYPGFGPVRGSPVPIDGDLAWVTVHGMVGGALGWLVEAGYSAASGGSSDGEHLFFATLEGQLLAVGAQGKAWQALLPGPGFGHPVVGEALLYVGYAAVDGRPGGVVAVDKQTGEVRWSWRADFELGAPPALGPALLVPCKDGQLVALDPESGDERWRAQATGELSVTPAVLGRFVVVGGADGTVSRYDLDDGGLVWRTEVGSAVTGDPTVFDGHLVLGLADGRVVALADAP